MNGEVFYLEPRNRRYHTRIDCQVLVSNEDIEVIIVKNRPTNVRPCSICGRDVPSPAHPRTEEPRG